MAFTSRGFLSVHKTVPATAEAEARRNSRRLNLTDDAFRSRSDSNIDDCSSNATCPYEVRKLLSEMSHFRRIVVNDIRIVWMMRRVVLVVSLGRIKGLQLDHLGNDRAREDFGFLELRDIGLGNPSLVVGVIENGRTVLAAGIGSLPVQLCGIVGHGEEDPKKLAIGDLGGIVGDLHRLCVAGLACADQLIFCSLSSASGVSRGRGDHAFYVLEDRLNAPETASSKEGCLLPLGRGNWSVQDRVRESGSRLIACVGSYASKRDYKEHARHS